MPDKFSLAVQVFVDGIPRVVVAIAARKNDNANSHQGLSSLPAGVRRAVCRSSLHACRMRTQPAILYPLWRDRIGRIQTPPLHFRREGLRTVHFVPSPV